MNETNIKHIAFIADGNRRWAKKHLLSRGLGHKRGFDKVVRVADHCCDLGVPYTSFFCFSTENWNRAKDEIDEIFRLIRENISKQVEHFVKKGVRVLFMGDLTKFPQDFQDAAADCIARTKDMKKMTMCIYVNYGGRADIIYAVKKLLAENKSSETLTEAEFSKYLYTTEPDLHPIPDPDMVVRTSGEHRLSNFTLWQMAYSELFFINTLWPDMTPKIVDGLIAEFNTRERRKGK